MHDNKSSWSNEKLTHLSKSYFITSKYKHIHNNIFIHDSFNEWIVVFLSINEVFNILTFT